MWAAQATAEVLEGRMEDASRFARVAQEAALDAEIPYALYMATAALAAIEARQGDLVAAERIWPKRNDCIASGVGHGRWRNRSNSSRDTTFREARSMSTA